MTGCIRATDIVPAGLTDMAILRAAHPYMTRFVLGLLLALVFIARLRNYYLSLRIYGSPLGGLAICL